MGPQDKEDKQRSTNKTNHHAQHEMKRSSTHNAQYEMKRSIKEEHAPSINKRKIYCNKIKGHPASTQKKNSPPSRKSTKKQRSAMQKKNLPTRKPNKKLQGNRTKIHFAQAETTSKRK